MSGCRAEPSQWPIAGYGARMSELPPEESKTPSPGDFPAAVRNPREVLLFGITPPRAETAPDRISEIAARTLARVEALPDRLLLYTDHGDATLDAVHAQGLEPISSIVRRSTLEDVFLHLTGRTLVD